MITRMLYLCPDKNRLHNMESAQSVIEHTNEYKIDNTNVYNSVHQIFKGTDLYPYVKEHKSMMDRRGTLCHPVQVDRPKPC